MDLMDNNITVGELLKNIEAREVLKSEFPQFTSPVMLSLARGMRLSEVLLLAKGHVEPERVDAALRRLREI